MSAVSKTAASLRIIGEMLDPDEISVILGTKPSLSYRKGEVIRNPTTGRERIPKYGMWNLRTEDRFPGDLDGQIDELLGKVTDDLSIWKELNERFSLDLFTGLFLEEFNEGISLKPSTLLALGLRGIELDLDIYSGENRDEDD
ncbi:DUF4279 domain-containing protein [Novosphingobium sp.]|uniref:DUF4279 domain-containing protein n=1 Tax=Novosphingobium sp. TaxID=1874826 RepID=UPI0025E06372|nr:DUF4279 domain-containing protein [Novosphingobium sp.]